MTRFYALKWIFQRITGALLLLFLTFHLWVNHYYNTNSLFYRIFLENLPPAGWSVLRLLFLITIIYHGANGLHTVLTDYVHKRPYMLFIEVCIILLSLISIVISWKFVF